MALKSLNDLKEEKKALKKKFKLVKAANRKLKNKERNKKRGSCKCGYKPKEPLHSCPYAEDMHGDYSKNCTCCSDCQHNCAMDI